MPDVSAVTVGFIGFGNMAQAIADGLLLKKVVPATRMLACARDWNRLFHNTEKRGIVPCRDVVDMVERATVLIIAVKPHQVEEVMAPLRERLSGKIVVSVAAALSFATYQRLLPGVHHLSTLPNTPVAVGEGIFICEKQHSLTEQECALVEALFSPIALLEWVESDHFDIAGVISGCGPAFVSMFMEALADGGLRHGLPRALGYRLAAQMVAGAGKLLLHTGNHPGAMKDAVCSPGGTTIVGVSALERRGFRSAIIDAVDAIWNK